MKKLNAKKIIVGTVISMGLALPLTATANGNLLGHPQTVEAATMKVALKHNAFLYNSKGHRVGKRKLYRGHSYTYYSVKSINGKVFYRVGKNRYIKSGNVKTSYILGRKKHAKKHTNRVNTGSIEETNTNTKLTINTAGMGTPKFQVSIDKTNADVFSASHTTANGSWIGTMVLDGTYNVYAEDNGMYEIGNGQWIHSNIAEVISNGSSQTNQNNAKKSTPINTATSNKTKKASTSSKSQSHTKALPTEADLQDAANRFLEMVNKDRAALGIKPLTLNTHLSEEAKQRSIHDAAHLVKYGTEDNHVDENGNLLLPSDTRAEICSPLSSHNDIAEFAHFEFMKNDAAAHWAHKRDLLNPEYSEIGIGITIGNGTAPITYGSLVCEFN